MKLDLTWSDFYVINAIVVVTGISTAMIGWRLPEVSLTFPALALINSLFFHVGPPLVQRRFSPGTITAALLFLPVGIWAYYGVYLDRVLTIRAGVLSALGGVLLMAYPIVLLRIKGRLPNYKNGI